MWDNTQAGSPAWGLGGITTIQVRDDQGGSNTGMRTGWRLDMFHKQRQYT